MATTYARLLHKISSIRANMSLAQRAFKWIICAKRPLVITELTEAIAFQPTDRSWKAEKIPDASRTIQACRNLVVLDETDKTVRLAHHSVRKFLLEAPTQDSIPEFHFKLRRASIEAGELCVAYLSFSDFERQLTTSIPDLCRVTGEVPGPSAILDSVRLSPASGHVASGITQSEAAYGYRWYSQTTVEFRACQACQAKAAGTTKFTGEISVLKIRHGALDRSYVGFL